MLKLTWDCDNGQPDIHPSSDAGWEVYHGGADKGTFTSIIKNKNTTQEVVFLPAMFAEGNLWKVMLMAEGWSQPEFLEGEIGFDADWNVVFLGLNEKLATVTSL